MRRKAQPTVLALVATKGGVGKTTIASALAVRAARDGGRVALVDTDPQGSLWQWWTTRGEPDNPKIIATDAEGVGLAIADRWDWIIVDSPPHGLALIEDAVHRADLVVIPCQPSGFDAPAVAEAVKLCNKHGVRYVCLLNRVRATGTAAAGTEEYLREDGPVLRTQIRDRAAYQNAVADGKSGPEIERDGKAAAEIDALWLELQGVLAKAKR
jgi:chromosome partitioning protein